MPPDWDAAAHEAVSVLPLARDNILKAWETGVPVAGMNLLCTQLRHPAMAKAFLSFNAHFFQASELPARVREILILRIAWLRRAEAEFIAHVSLARRAGMTDEEIERVQLGANAPDWTPEEADLVRAVDELRADARITDATWAALARRFNTQQMIELVMIVGCYELLAMAFNSFGVQLEAGAAALDAAARARMHGQ